MNLMNDINIKNKFNILSDEIWFFIASYSENLLDFVKFWSNTRLFFLIKRENKHFWENLLLYYMNSRNADVTKVLGQLLFAPRNDPYQLIIELFKRKKCSRSGCFKYFSEWENTPRSCCFHSGKLKSNSKLSCCGVSSFNLKGCKFSYHNGIFYSMVSFNLSKVSKSSSTLAMDNTLKLPELQNITKNTLPKSNIAVNENFISFLPNI